MNERKGALITFEDALAKVLHHARPLPSIRTIRLEDSLGYFLAEDIRAREPIPLFDHSAMDGYGVREADVAKATPSSPVRLRIAGLVRAGDNPQSRLKPGTAVKIFTGGKIPPGVEAVVVKESCAEGAGDVVVRESVRAGANIRRRGEEIRNGARVLHAGTRITPTVVGLLATLGYASFAVHEKPRVTLLVTGNELVPPGKPLRPGQIRDSNSYALLAALKETGIDKTTVRRVKDDKKSLQKTLETAISQSDFVITSGGVSVGDFDFVKDVALAAGVRTIFWKIAIKPGMPNYFGVRSGTLVFGLPGNPVSALVSYHEFVKPALLKMSGQRKTEPFVLTATLEKPLKKKRGRLELVRGVLTVKDGQLTVAPAELQGSHMLTGLASANCLIRFPLDLTSLEPGQPVSVELLSWETH